MPRTDDKTPCNGRGFRNGGHLGGQVEMVNFCAIVGCANRAGRDKDKSFYRLPAIIKNRGAQTEQLSERRLRNWLAAIR